MKPLTIIYWTRVLLGVVAALICTFLSSISKSEINLLNGLSVALLVYIITYYIYKALFIRKVEKPTKIFTQAVFAYFVTWLVLWTLLYTILFSSLKIPLKIL
jgi:hypothetical protein